MSDRQQSRIKRIGKLMLPMLVLWTIVVVTTLADRAYGSEPDTYYLVGMGVGITIAYTYAQYDQRRRQNAV